MGWNASGGQSGSFTAEGDSSQWYTLNSISCSLASVNGECFEKSTGQRGSGNGGPIGVTFTVNGRSASATVTNSCGVAGGPIPEKSQYPTGPNQSYTFTFSPGIEVDGGSTIGWSASWSGCLSCGSGGSLDPSPSGTTRPKLVPVYRSVTLNANGSGFKFDEIMSYDTATDTLGVETTKLPYACSNISALTYPDRGEIYLIGGDLQNEQSTAVSIFDPETGLITDAGVTTPVAFTVPGIATVNGIGYLIAGNTKNIYAFNPVDNSFILKNAKVPVNLKTFGTAVILNKIYLLGGQVGNKGVNTIYEYDPSTDVLVTKDTHLPTAVRATTGSDLVGHVYLFGGQEGSSSTRSANIYDYDPSTDTVIKADSFLKKAVAYAKAATVNDHVFIFGGYCEDSSNPRDDSITLFF